MRDKGFELLVKAGEVGMRGDAVERGVVAVVALVFPYVDYYYCIKSVVSQLRFN